MSQPQPQPVNQLQLEQAFEAFTRVSHELDTSYRELENKVEGLTKELLNARSARLRELAEKERLAHRLSSLIAALPGGVLIVDESGLVRDANPEAIGLLGGPLMSEHWDDVLARSAQLSAQTGKEISLKSGKRISVVSRQLDLSGDRVVLITDVTEIHQLQEQLGQKKRLAALGEMAARLAHQIRTPLSSTTLYLSQLGREDLPADRRRDISAKVVDRLGHMGKLVDGMLSFVRGEAPVQQVIYLNQVLASFENTVRPQLVAGNASLSVPEVDNTLVVLGDLDELAGVLCNLAMNAVEASEAPVSLDVWVGALNNEWLQIRFRDDGPGISEDIVERVFDPFFTTRAQGTGLGLAVVAKTISQHGGDISVHNRVSGGAEFVINLPMALPAESCEDAAA